MRVERKIQCNLNYHLEINDCVNRYVLRATTGGRGRANRSPLSSDIENEAKLIKPAALDISASAYVGRGDN